MEEPKTRQVKLIIEYDGGGFSGWQIQAGRRTVQQELKNAWKRVTGEVVSVPGASRTDAGVHAEGQVAAIRTRSRIATDRLVHALNYYLPEDVRVRRAVEVPLSFHPQFQARSKIYRYTVLHSWTPRPLHRRTALLVRGPLAIRPMRQAARSFVGRHDFRAFGSAIEKKKTTIRTVVSFRVIRKGEFVVFEVEGDGFLHRMVRAMVGTLLRVGQGRIHPSEVGRILREGDRRAAGPVVPPHGLCLVRVKYR